MTALDKSHKSPQPLYVQIKEALKRQILDGQYQPHERLPSENELMRKFGVSRITVRQALRDLYNEKLVFSAQGKGTFVSKPKAVQDIQHLQGFAEAMHAKGYDISARVLSVREVRPKREIQDNLRISGGHDVLEIKRVRYLNREPMSIDTSYFSLNVGRKLLNRDLSLDIFPMLENQLGIELGHADITLEARAASAESANFLGIDTGSPIMWVTRLTHTRNGEPLDFEYLQFKGESYQYHFTIDRKKEHHS